MVCCLEVIALSLVMALWPMGKPERNWQKEMQQVSRDIYGIPWLSTINPTAMF